MRPLYLTSMTLLLLASSTAEANDFCSGSECEKSYRDLYLGLSSECSELVKDKKAKLIFELDDGESIDSETSFWEFFEEIKSDLEAEEILELEVDLYSRCVTEGAKESLKGDLVIASASVDSDEIVSEPVTTKPVITKPVISEPVISQLVEEEDIICDFSDFNKAKTRLQRDLGALRTQVNTGELNSRTVKKEIFSLKRKIRASLPKEEACQESFPKGANSILTEIDRLPIPGFREGRA